MGSLRGFLKNISFAVGLNASTESLVRVDIERCVLGRNATVLSSECRRFFSAHRVRRDFVLGWVTPCGGTCAPIRCS